MGIRLVVIDDNPHLAWDGATYSANATFERFVAALLDLPGAPVALDHDVRAGSRGRCAAGEPAARPADPGRGHGALRRDRGVPAPSAWAVSGQPTDAVACDRGRRSRSGSRCRHRMRRWPGRSRRGPVCRASCGWPGARADVAAGRFDGARGVGGRAIGAGYDVVGRLVGLGGRRLVVGEGVVDGEGVVASLVEPSEVRDPAARPWPPADPDAIRLVWAGRLVGGKGLEALLEAVDLDRRLMLDIVGDGPDRARLREIADASGARNRITWVGHLTDRVTYLDRLAAADVFVFPSPAEGFPKVVLDAFAVGLPVVADAGGWPRRAGRCGSDRADRPARRDLHRCCPGRVARARAG